MSSTAPLKVFVPLLPLELFCVSPPCALASHFLRTLQAFETIHFNLTQTIDVDMDILCDCESKRDTRDVED